MVYEGTAYWASVTTPNTRFEPKYTIDLVVDEDTAEQLRTSGLTIKDKEEGPTVTMKRNVNGPNGMVRRAPRLIDRNKEELDCLVGNGSKVRVQYKEWEVNRYGKNFKGLDLMAVQVLDLVSYNGAGDEFDVEESLEESDEL